MTLVAFPLAAIRGGAIQIQLNALTSLASQASEMIRQDQVVELHTLLEGHGIKLCEQGQAVRELAIGFSLSFRVNSSLEIEQTERVARCVVEAGLETAITIAEAENEKYYLIVGAALAIPEAGYPNGTSDYFDRLITAAQAVDEPSSRSWTLRGIAEILSKSEWFGRARGVFEEAIASARQVSPVPVSPANAVLNPFSELAPDLVRAGYLDRAREIYEEAIAFDRRRLDPALLTFGLIQAGRGLVEAGYPNRAREIFEEAIPRVRQDRDPDMDLRFISLTQIARGLAEAGYVDRAQEVFGEAIACCWEGEGEEIDDDGGSSVPVRALSYIADNLVECGLVSRPSELFDRLLAPLQGDKNSCLRASALLEIASHNIYGERNPSRTFSGLKKVGLEDHSSEWFDLLLAAYGEIADSGEYLDAFFETAKLLAGFRRDDRVLDLFDRIVSTVRKTEEPGPRASDLCEIAAILEGFGLSDRAREIFEETIAVARKIRNRRDRQFAQESLIGDLEKAGFSDLAEKVRSEITPGNTRR